MQDNFNPKSSDPPAIPKSNIRASSRFNESDKLDRDLSYIIGQHRGEANGVEHRTLVKQIFGEFTLLNDRHIRASIERLRRGGLLIGNTQSGKGYFLCDSPQEYESFRNVFISHALPILETCRSMDAAAAERWQVEPRQGVLF